MKIRIYTITVLIGSLLLVNCSEYKKRPSQINKEITEWEFIDEIRLEGISPIGIVALGDFLWLSDVDHNRVVTINLKGKIINEYTGFKRPMHIALQENKIYIPEYVSDTIKILENGKVSTLVLEEKPDAIGAVDVEGHWIAVADFYNHRIILQNKDAITLIGKEGHGDGELYYPTDVDIENDLIYVADAYNNRVQVFDLKGNYIKVIGWKESIKVAIGLKVTENQVIIADFEGGRVLVYDHDGALIQILAGKFNQPTDIEIIENTMYVVNYKGKTITIYKK